MRTFAAYWLFFSLLIGQEAIAQYIHNIEFKETNYSSLSPKDENIITLENGTKKILPSNYLIIFKLEKNNFIVAKTRTDLTEQSRYSNFVLLDSTFKEKALADNLENYSVLFNIGGIDIAQTNGNVYIPLLNTKTNKYNYINSEGKLQLILDVPSMKYLFDDYLLLTENNKETVYRLYTNKTINIPPGYEYFKKLNNFKKIVLWNKDDFMIYDLENEKKLFSTKGTIYEFEEKEPGKPNKYLYVSLPEYQFNTIDTFGNSIITGNFVPVSYDEETITMKDYNNSLLKNTYNLKTKSFIFPIFAREIRTTNNLTLYFLAESYLVIRKSDSLQLYVEEDYVTSYKNLGNMTDLTKKIVITNPNNNKLTSTFYYKDIFSNKTDSIIFTEIKDFDPIKYTSKYFVLKTKNNNTIIIDVDGQIILPEQKTASGIFCYNYGVIEIKDRNNNKILQSIKIN